MKTRHSQNTFGSLAGDTPRYASRARHFIRGIFIALCLSAVAAVAYPLVVTFFGATVALCVLVAGLSFYGTGRTSVFAVPGFAGAQIRRLRRFNWLLTIVAFITAWVALIHTQSIFLSVWCFFLLLMLGDWLPDLARGEACRHAPVVGYATELARQNLRFTHAERTAEAALRQLLKSHG